MSDEQIAAMAVLTHWMLNLRIGNGPTLEAWEEVRKTIGSLTDQERETFRVLVADLLTELDGENN